MIEIHHAIFTIVAVDASGAILFDVRRQIVMVRLCVTGDAIQGAPGEAILAVAAVTIQRAAIVILLVAFQAKTRQSLMIDILKGKMCKRMIASLVLGVAGLAFFHTGQNIVQPKPFSALASDRLVTFLATVVRNAVNGRMAVAAFFLKISMGDVTADGLILRVDGADRTRV
jgi:hypothetical protein